MNKWMGLAIGGLLGTFSRYLLSVFFQKQIVIFPYGTLCINLLGCFISGFLFIFAEEKGLLNSDLRLFLQVGFVNLSH